MQNPRMGQQNNNNNNNGQIQSPDNGQIQSPNTGQVQSPGREFLDNKTPEKLVYTVNKPNTKTQIIRPEIVPQAEQYNTIDDPTIDIAEDVSLVT
eukprot:UN04059